MELRDCLVISTFESASPVFALVVLFPPLRATFKSKVVWKKNCTGSRGTSLVGPMWMGCLKRDVYGFNCKNNLWQTWEER